MSQLKTKKGEVILIDRDDLKSLPIISWYLDKKGYARCKLTVGYKKRKTVLLHRMIMKAGPNEEVDHKNGNTTDNRRKNLRVCTKAQNKLNSSIYKTNKSGYKGVDKVKTGWRAQIQVNKKKTQIGIFPDKISAAIAYNEKAKELHGIFARLNTI